MACAYPGERQSCLRSSNTADSSLNVFPYGVCVCSDAPTAYYRIIGNVQTLERFRDEFTRLWRKFLGPRRRRARGLAIVPYACTTPIPSHLSES